MVQSPPTRRQLLLIAAAVAVGTAARLLYVLHYQATRGAFETYGDDGAAIALNVLERGEYVADTNLALPRRSYRMPLFPLMILASWKAAGSASLLVAKAVMAFLSGLNIALTALLAWSLFGAPAAVAAAWLSVPSPNGVHWPARLVPDIPAATIMLTLAVLFAARRWAPAGAAGGALILLRPVYYPFVLALAAAAAAADRRRARAAALFLAPVLALLAPWVARNWRVHGTLLATSTEGGQTFLECNNPLSFAAGGEWQGQDLHPVSEMPAKAAALSEVEFDRWAYREGLANIARDPAGFVRVFFLRMGYLWRPLPREGYSPALSWLALAAWLPVFLLGLAQALRLRVWRLPEHWPMILACLWLTFAAGLVNGVIRYRTPLEPYFTALAAGWLAARLRR